MRRVLGVALGWCMVVPPLPAQPPASLPDSVFAALVGALSERGGFFDTDNLISNEDSYLHPLGALKRLGVSGGAYLGVGPDQNFSYIAAVKPHIAFILDIRRDNMLEHVLFKSIFALARNRLEYLCLLFGKPAPDDTTGWGARSIDELLAYLDRSRRDPIVAGRVRARVLERVRHSLLASAPADAQTIATIHATFVQEGPELRFSSLNRAPQPYYPDFRRLVLETDRGGRQGSFLAHEVDFQFVKQLEERNLVVPLVGDFAGEKALRAIAQWLRAHDERISLFYTSNVEQYLFRDGTFAQFAKNVEGLPRDARSVLVRSYFQGGHAQAVPGYHSVQLVQTMDAFAQLIGAGTLRSYADLITRELVTP